MAEFDPTTPAMRLFDEIDLAPAPQTTVLQRVLNTWREERGDELLPSVTAMQSNIASAVTNNIFMFAPSSDNKDLSLSGAGRRAMELFGCEAAGAQLSQFTDRRVAVYARHVFELARRRREAVCVRFTLRPHGEQATAYEMLAAPVSKGDEPDWIFGAVAAL
jgi:hypothetical protein